MHYGHITANTLLKARRMPRYCGNILLAKEPITNTFMEATGIYLRILFIYLLLFFSNTISNTIFPLDSGRPFTTAERTDNEYHLR